MLISVKISKENKKNNAHNFICKGINRITIVNWKHFSMSSIPFAIVFWVSNHLPVILVYMKEKLIFISQIENLLWFLLQWILFTVNNSTLQIKCGFINTLNLQFINWWNDYFRWLCVAFDGKKKEDETNKINKIYNNNLLFWHAKRR